MRTIDAIADWIGRAAATLFVAAAAITIYEVVARYIFDAPTTWVHEVTKTLCALGFAMGGAYCMTHNNHIRVGIIADRLSQSWRHRLETGALAVGAFYLAGLGYAAFLGARQAVWRFDFQGWSPERTPGPPNLPLPAIIKAGLAIGTLLFLAVVVMHLVAHLRGRRPLSSERAAKRQTALTDREPDA